MRSTKRWAKLTAVAAATTLALAACGGGSSQTPSSSGTTDSNTSTGGAPSGQLNLGVAYETTNYDPSTTSSALAMGANWHAAGLSLIHI